MEAEGHNPIHFVLGTWELPKRATPVLARRLTNCFIFITCLSSPSSPPFSSHSAGPSVARVCLHRRRLLFPSNSGNFAPKRLIIGSQDLDVVEVQPSRLVPSLSSSNLRSGSVKMAMDAKEIELKAKALTKAATQNEPAANIVSLLKELQTGVKATEDLLRSTRVGIIVNKFKQHKSPEVARLSSEIVSKWRNEVNKQKANGSPSVSQRSSGSPRPAQNGTASPAGTTPSDKMSKLSVPPDKRTWKADGVDINQTSNKIRDSCIGLMYDGLCLNSTESPRAVLSKACAVEAAAFSALGPETKEQYRTKIRSLYQNLKNKSNPTLRVRVLSNEVTPEQFVKMSHDELKSAEQREQERKIQKENMDKAMVAQAERSISTSLQCGKCGQRKVTYTEAQTRSADEPMTLFCTCMNCGKSWRQ
ncbi:transcription elongation factor S-II [Aspergillus lentulus]|nr:transcription elongation factor S-II [Aspergillus lentulus]